MRERTDVCGRFAPSPSGRMHLGNVFCAVLAWLSARSRGGRFLLRIEDLDVRRCKPEHARLLEEDLAWLGLDWDEGGRRGGPDGPYFQSECSELYAQALQMLKEHARVYPCFCSRADLHADDNGAGRDVNAADDHRQDAVDIIARLPGRAGQKVQHADLADGGDAVGKQENADQSYRKNGRKRADKKHAVHHDFEQVFHIALLPGCGFVHVFTP